MAKLDSVVLRAFTGGELSPALGARADVTKYLAGAATIRNFLVQRHGGLHKRPGTQYLATVKTPSAQPRLVAFHFKAADRNYLLEFGNLYVRFYWHDAPVMDPGAPSNPLEVVTPYTTADLASLKFAQSIDVLTITHPSYGVRELQRLAHDNWTLSTASFAPTIDAPAGGSGTAGVAGTQTYRYIVTAAKTDTYEESVGSSTISITCDTPTSAAPNVVSWSAVTGAAEYYVYLDRFNNGVFGYIGTATGTSFRDPGFEADPTITPPVLRDVFGSSDHYPSVAAYWQQRLWFGNSNTDRETVWGSRVGAFHNYTISTPLQDDDSLEFIIAGTTLNPVEWLMGLTKFLVMSDAGIFLVQGDETGVVRPTAINIDQVGYIGVSSTVRPVAVGSAILYADSANRAVYDLTAGTQQGESYGGEDLTIFAAHLFDGYTIETLAYSRVPNSTIYVVRSDGTLLTLTYIKEQEVVAWARHDTDGTVEDVVVLENTDGDDDVYLLVARTINGSATRFVEKFADRYVPDVTAIEDAWYVDAGLKYDGAAATAISGLAHLNGERVAVLADGVVISDGRTGTSYTVAAGALSPSLTTAASTVIVGLPMPYADVETLELDVSGTSLRDKEKRVPSVTALVWGARHGFTAGPDFDNLTTERKEPWETATALWTGQTDVAITCNFDRPGRVCVRHDQPLPFALLALIPRVEVS